MKENVLIFPENESISFSFSGTYEDGDTFILPEGYKYYFRVKNELEDELLINIKNTSSRFNIENNLNVGSYYFEFGITNGENDFVIFSPVDSTGKKLNELKITRRLL